MHRWRAIFIMPPTHLGGADFAKMNRKSHINKLLFIPLQKLRKTNKKS